MMGVEELILTFSYFAIILLMTSNGFVTFPSSQLLYIVAGYFVSTGNLSFALVILFGALGHSMGNFILYEVSRRKGVKYALKFFKYMFPVDDGSKLIKQIDIAFRKKGIFFLFVGKLVNPIKIFIPIPAGISKMNRVLFLLIVFITSAIWATIFTSIGFYFGKSFENFTIYGVVMLAIFLSVTYYFYKYINSDEILKELNKK
jgi:membrane protein DedA with SNARE-associated domain